LQTSCWLPDPLSTETEARLSAGVVSTTDGSSLCLTSCWSSSDALEICRGCCWFGLARHCCLICSPTSADWSTARLEAARLINLTRSLEIERILCRWRIVSEYIPLEC
jgi:hypothetical protein